MEWRSKALGEIPTVVILIVDDNAAVRRLMRRTITDSNHDIHECADGAEALRRYSELLPDLIFMDIRMPGMDGLTATRKIIDKYPGAQIAIVTDYDVREIKAAAFAAGAKAYVLKDNLPDLEVVINELLIT